jgi:uncharacterized membrane protein YfcA
VPSDPAALASLAALVLAAAVLYSSVGHAGASAYLAAMALFGVTPAASKPAALVMNVAVATVVTLRFGAEGLVPWRRLAPLVLGSVPAAFVGGLVALPSSLHRVVLGALLAFAGLRLLWAGPREIPRHRPPAAFALVALGVAIGLFAGLTGVGGGIFLSPLLLFAGWEDTRHAAGASAAFILANWVAGLAGHWSAGRLVPHGTVVLTLLALAGGFVGSWVGAKKLAPPQLKRLLGLVLLVAAAKLVVAR